MPLLKKGLLVGLVLSFFMTSGIAWGQESAEEPAVQAETDSDTVIASYGSRELTYGDLQSYKKFFVPQGGGDDRRLIENWLANAYIADMAEKQNLEDDPEVASVLKFARDQILSTLLLRHKQLEVTVADEDIKKFYNENIENFQKDFIVTVKLIAAETKEKSDQIKEQIIKEGKDFDTLVRENEEQTKKLTGLSSAILENVSTEQMTEPLGRVIAASLARININEISGPRASGKNWFLFQVSDRQSSDPAPLEEVRETIHGALARQQHMKIAAELMAEARRETGITPPEPTPTPAATDCTDACPVPAKETEKTSEVQE